MQTRTVEYEDENLKIRLVVRDATAFVGMKRSILTREGLRWLRKQYARDGKEDDEKDDKEDARTEGAVSQRLDKPLSGKLDPESLDAEAMGLIAHRLIPDLVSCVVDVEGLDLDTVTPEMFMELPDALVDAWEAAVYDLNRHWLGLPEPKKDKDADPKEPETPTSSE